MSVFDLFIKQPCCVVISDFVVVVVVVVVWFVFCSMWPFCLFSVHVYCCEIEMISYCVQ